MYAPFRAQFTCKLDPVMHLGGGTTVSETSKVRVAKVILRFSYDYLQNSSFLEVLVDQGRIRNFAALSNDRASTVLIW